MVSLAYMKDEYHCKRCNKEVIDKYRKRIYCSRSCQVKSMNTGKRRSELWGMLDTFIIEYNSGMTFKEIGEKHGKHKDNLQRLFKIAGIEVRRIGIRNGRIPWNKGLTGIWTGEKNPRWKGGISSLVNKVRTCKKYKEWVKECYQRDNWTCQICSKRGGDLNVDHYPVMFSKIMETKKITSYEQALDCKELWDTSNGRTLCVKCHRKTFIFKGNQFTQVCSNKTA